MNVRSRLFWKRAAWYVALTVARHVFLIAVVCALLISFLTSSVSPVTRVDGPAASATSPAFDHSTATTLIAIQITDLHISEESETDTIKFREWTEVVLPVIRPSLVLVTGDITDGVITTIPLKLKAMEGAWQTYQSIRQNATNRLLPSAAPLWVETEGNHDFFGVSPSSSAFRLSETYTASGVDIIKQVREIDLKTPSGSTVRFIVYQSMIAGANWPNVISNIHSSTWESVQTSLKSSPPPRLAVCHHPLKMSTEHLFYESPLDNLRSDVPFFYHLSGHAHMGGYLRYNAGHQQDDPMELVLATMKNSWWRLIVVDNGVFAFRDFQVDDCWPAIVIVAPKPARFLAPGDWLASNFIRVAVYSPAVASLTSVSASVDDIVVCSSMQLINDDTNRSISMYECNWTATSIDQQAMHRLSVTAVDSLGHSATVSEDFSFDNSVLESDTSSFVFAKFLPGLLVGWWLFLSIFTLLLLVLPKLLYYPIIHWLTKNPVFGAISLANIQQIDYAPTIAQSMALWDEYCDTQALKWWGKCIVWVTWELQSTVVSMASISWVWLACLYCLWTVHIASPLIVTNWQIDGVSTDVMFSWGSVVGTSSSVLGNECALLFSIAYLLLVFYPLYHLIVSVTNYSIVLHKLQQQDNKNISKWWIPTVVQVCLFVVMVAASVAIWVLIALLFNKAIGLFASPLTYLCVVSCCIALLFVTLHTYNHHRHQQCSKDQKQPRPIELDSHSYSEKC